MQWRKDMGARVLIGHLNGYGCQVNVIASVEELCVLAAEIFGVTNTGNCDQMAEAIRSMKAKNRSHTRRVAYANIRRLWPVINSFWVETESLKRRDEYLAKRAA